MTAQERQEIMRYLSSPSNYVAGLALYQQHGTNRALLRRFTTGRPDQLLGLLNNELCNLAGITARELAQLQRLAYTAPPAGAREDIPTTPPHEQRQEMPERVKRLVKLREQFPFLNSPSCPDRLKILLSDMITANAMYREAHARLLEVQEGDIATGAAEARTIIKYFIFNREAWATLEAYKTSGVLPQSKEQPPKAQAAAEDMTAAELFKELQNARANVSKWTKKHRAGSDRAEEMLKLWRAKKMKLEAEIERRRQPSA